MYAHALACTPKEISMKVTVTVTVTLASPLPGRCTSLGLIPHFGASTDKNGLILPSQA